MGDLADDGEAEAAAGLAGVGEAEEALEDLLAGRGRDAGAVVLDLDQAAALGAAAAHCDFAGGRRVVEGVDHQVGDHLAEQQAVAGDLGVIELEAEVEPAGLGQADPFGAAFADEVGQVDGFGEAGVAAAGQVLRPGARTRTGGSLADLGLTPRQRQVMQLLLHGKSNKLIARDLGISVETVKDHVAAVLRSLGVTSRTQAVLAVGLMSDLSEGSLS